MAVKAIVEAIDQVPEPLRALYKEHEGKFILQVEPVDGFGIEDVSGLKNTLSKEMTKRKEFEKIASKFKDIDPDKAREAISKLDEFATFDPTKEADKIAQAKVEAVRSQLVDKHSKEMAALLDRNGQQTKAIENLLIDQAATVALTSAKGSVELLLPHVQRHARVREVDGRYVVEIVDKDGNVRIGDAKGTPMTLDGLVHELKQSEQFGRAFDGTGQGGSGMRPGNNGGTPHGSLKKKSELKDRKDRAAFVTQYGAEAYFALPD